MIEEYIEEELWANIDDFPDYAISNLGNVQHAARPNTNRKLAINHQGFPTLTLFRANNPSRYVRQVNKLVATAFLDPPTSSNMTAVWHVDGNLLNCAAYNLRWERRDRVLEWNDMHRRGTPKFNTPKVMNNQTGNVYDNAFECGMAEGELESTIVSHIECYPEQYANHARWRYL